MKMFDSIDHVDFVRGISIHNIANADCWFSHGRLICTSDGEASRDTDTKKDASSEIGPGYPKVHIEF